MFKRVYDLPKCDLKQYFDEVQIQQASHYAYGEEIATLTERADDRFSLTRSYENLTQRLVLLDGPWENLQVDSEKEKISERSHRTGSKTRKLRVFLSYASADRDKAQDLYFRLRKDGFDPWIDKEKLLPGQNWSLEIRKVIEETDVIIVCLSKNSVRKEGYVQKELRYALDVADETPAGAIFMIPIRLEETEVPNALANLQWVDYFSTEKENGYRQLILALNQRAEALGISTVFSKGLELVDPLTDDQWKMLSLKVEGKSNAEIARQLGYAELTIRSKMNEIYRRLSANNALEAIRWFEKNAPKYGHSNISD